MIVKGSIIEQVKVIGGFDFVGDKFEVVDVTDTTVAIKHGSLGMGVMSFPEMMEYFKAVVDEWSEWKIVSYDTAKSRTPHGKWEYRTKGKETQVRNNYHTALVGYSNCLPEDEYSLETGIQVAMLKADISYLEKMLRGVDERLSKYMR